MSRHIGCSDTFVTLNVKNSFPINLMSIKVFKHIKFQGDLEPFLFLEGKRET